MYCDRAIIAIKSLTDSGAVLTPEEVIRLNSYGVEMEKTPADLNVINAPRVAWLGDVPIFQPTIQSDEWIETYAQAWWKDDENIALAGIWACGHARESDFFTDKLKKSAVKKLINEWYAKIPCGKDELGIAFSYVSGSYEINEENTADIEKQIETSCPYTSIINECIAAGLGLTVTDIRSMTIDQASQVLTRWSRFQVAAGGGDVDDMTKHISTLAFVKYSQYLDKLRAKYGNE